MRFNGISVLLVTTCFWLSVGSPTYAGGSYSPVSPTVNTRFDGPVEDEVQTASVLTSLINIFKSILRTSIDAKSYDVVVYSELTTEITKLNVEAESRLESIVSNYAQFLEDTPLSEVIDYVMLENPKIILFATSYRQKVKTMLLEEAVKQDISVLMVDE